MDCRISRRTMVGLSCLLPFTPRLGWAQATADGSSVQLRQTQVDAPFTMPPVTAPDFSACPLFPITDYGSSQQDQRATQAAIAAASAAASAAGGGTVVVPAGTWPTGPVHLHSDVNLHLADGAVLLFSDDPADYLPAVQTSWEGIECFNYSPLIYAFGAQNVGITGTGRLQAKLDRWSEWYNRPPAHMQALVDLYTMARTGVPVEQRQMAVGDNNLRPQFIQFNRCERVLVEGVASKAARFGRCTRFCAAMSRSAGSACARMVTTMMASIRR